MINFGKSVKLNYLCPLYIKINAIKHTNEKACNPFFLASYGNEQLLK